MYQSLKGCSYPQPALPVDTKPAQQPAGSEESPSARVQHDSPPLNTKPSPTDIDTYTAVTNWLATSQTFEHPPSAASNADPAPRKRLAKEHWLAISKNLDMRIRSRAEHLKGPNHSCPRLVYGTHHINVSGWETRLQSKLAEPDKDTPLGQINACAETSLSPRLAHTRGADEEQAQEKTSSIEAGISQLQEKLETKHNCEQGQQLGVAHPMNAADEAARALAKPDLNIPPKTTNPQQLAPETQLKPTTEAAIKTKAKILATSAITAHKPEQERKERENRKKKYMEGRAREIHARMLLCKPFDVDAVRRELESEEEVRGVKRRVRELGFKGEE